MGVRGKGKGVEGERRREMRRGGRRKEGPGVSE